MFFSLSLSLPLFQNNIGVRVRDGEFHIKLLEISIISHLKPEINSINIAVSYTFPSINIESYKPIIGFKLQSISVYDQAPLPNGNNGTIRPALMGKWSNGRDSKGIGRKTILPQEKYYSINIAKAALGLTEYGIRWYRNRENHFIFCPKSGLDLRFVDNNLKTIFSSAPLTFNKNLIPITGFNLVPEAEIPIGVIYAYLDDKETLYNIFSTASEFASVHDLNPWQAYRNINKERAIPISEGLLSIYLCCNPLYRNTLLDIQDKKNWPVVSIDTKDKNFIRYHKNPNACRKELSDLLGITEITHSVRNLPKII